MESTETVRPLPVLPTIGLFLVPAIILYVTHYVIVPSFVVGTGQPYLVGYLIGWGSTMALFFLLSWRLCVGSLPLRSRGQGRS